MLHGKKWKPHKEGILTRSSMSGPSATPPSLVWVYGALALAQLTFSGQHITTQLALDADMPPSLFSLLRLLIASPVVLALAAMRDRTLPERKHHPRLMLLGLLGVSGSQGFALAGLYFTDPINLAVAQPLQPIITAALSVALGIEPFSSLKALGIVTSFFGCLFVVLLGAKTDADEAAAADDSHRNWLAGNLCLLLNCTCMAAFLILQKPILAVLPSWTVSAWALTWGIAPIAIWVLVSAFTTQPSPAAMLAHATSASPMSWAAIAYAGVMAAGVALMLISFGVKHAGATAAASLVPLQPLFSTILAVLVLHEYPAPGQYLGAVLIISGLWLVLHSSHGGSWCDGRDGTDGPGVRTGRAKRTCDDDEESVRLAAAPLPAAAEEADGNANGGSAAEKPPGLAGQHTKDDDRETLLRSAR